MDILRVFRMYTKGYTKGLLKILNGYTESIQEVYTKGFTRYTCILKVLII